MPLLKLYCSESLPDGEGQALLTSLSQDLAELLRKPESYVMTCLVAGAKLTFAGSDEPCCLVEVANLGKLEKRDTERMSAALCKRLSEALSLPSRRIYIVFADVERHMWGYDGGTFG